ncbi:bifunctional riboflavin kinase/FAD synthetase [Flavobacterium amniphilum]|uniref:bifunctional riboflavin kinase/FAD synthetase n=1 Tax=Flavobacterium amniphilum TaxID=1834035 RepID=UPI00202A31F3|nr:bifunctional riboflavin kinase/FAD synthetase [Flavobacterium amniphilum]MCL9807151.1 bifunctional riboflavin kinase/FAD synthetase [Flavobacterium amniphilum]
MKVFHSIFDFKPKGKTIITLGTFDGVHIGHKKIIDKLLKNARIDDLETAVITFAQHPRNVLHSKESVSLLNTTPEKIHQLESTGIDNLIILNFDNTLSELSGEEFVKTILVDQLNLQKIIIGYDHRFGKNRSSDIHDLINFGKKYHFDVEQISAEEIDEITISSTKIRNAVGQGNIDLANQYLGYHYSFTGIVVKGNQLGRTIGFPTANIQINDPLKIIPGNGVYVVTGKWNNKLHQGMMNIGTKPTIDGKNLSIEVNFFDVNEDLYGKEIEISVLHHLRNEQKFDSLDSLKNQIFLDKKASLTYFN